MRKIIVGRSPDVDYSIAADSISRRHCRFTFNAGRVWVEDMGSTNGVTLNGEPLPPRKRVRVPPNSEVILGDEVLLDWKLIQGLKALAEPKRASSWWQLKMPKTTVSFNRLFQVASLPVVAIVVVLILLGAWFGFSYSAYNSQASKANAILSDIAEADSDLWSDDSQISYSDLVEYKEKVNRHLDKLDEPLRSIEGSFSKRLFFGSGTIEIRSAVATAKDEQESRFRLIDRVIESARSDHAVFIGAKESVQSELEKVAQSISQESDVDQLRTTRNQIADYLEVAKQASSDLKAAKQGNSFEGEAEVVRQHVYNHMVSEMEAAGSDLSSAETLLSDAVDYQTAHHQNLREVSARILDQSAGISAIYQRVQPIAQDLSAEIQPARQAIQTLEEPIGSGLLSRGTTPLSIIRSIDPATGQAISTIRDLINLVDRIGSDVTELARNIEPLRDKASSFRSSPDRSNAISLSNRASNARQYISSKRDLFDPLASQINDGRRYVGRFEAAISSAPRPAQNFLREFPRAANSLLSTLEQPVEAWRSNVGSTIDQLDQITRWEEEYADIISNIGSIGA